MRILLIILFFLGVNCKEKREGFLIDKNNNAQAIEEPSENVNFHKNRKVDSIFNNLEELKLPTSSDFVSGLLNENEGFYEIKDVVMKNNIKFPKDLFTEVKSKKEANDFFYNITEKEFFPIFKKVNTNYTTIGSLVQYYGENDIKGVFVILSNFDTKGKQIDYLIIYNRFLWEVNYEYDFYIDSNFQIIIDKKEENFWDDKRNDFINEDEIPETKIFKEKYLINDNGLFVHVS